MHSCTLKVLGLDVSFTSEADDTRVKCARALVEERFEKLRFHGRQLSKETLLTFLALGLADDLLQANQQNEELQRRITEMLIKIEDLA